MILCYSPVFITSVIHAILPMQDNVVARDFATAVTFMNSAVNPFLYWWRPVNFEWQSLKKYEILCLNKERKTSQDFAESTKAMYEWVVAQPQRWQKR